MQAVVGGHHTYSTELGEHLNGNAVHQSGSPLRNSKHDEPAWSCDSFLCRNGLLDFIELLIDPFVVATIVVELSQNSQGFIFSVGCHEMTRTLGKENHPNCKDLEG